MFISTVRPNAPTSSLRVLRGAHCTGCHALRLACLGGTCCLRLGASCQLGFELLARSLLVVILVAHPWMLSNLLSRGAVDSFILEELEHEVFEVSTESATVNL